MDDNSTTDRDDPGTGSHRVRLAPLLLATALPILLCGSLLGLVAARALDRARVTSTGTETEAVVLRPPTKEAAIGGDRTVVGFSAPNGKEYTAGLSLEGEPRAYGDLVPVHVDPDDPTRVVAADEVTPSFVVWWPAYAMTLAGLLGILAGALRRSPRGAGESHARDVRRWGMVAGATVLASVALCVLQGSWLPLVGIALFYVPLGATTFPRRR